MMPASADPRRTLLDPWVDLSRGNTSNNNRNNNNKRAFSSAGGHKGHLMKSDTQRLYLKDGGGSRQRELEEARIRRKYEASLARALDQRGKPGSQSPAMDVWALALGVDIEHSKATDRARRKVELEEAGHRTDPGAWTPLVPPTTAPSQALLGNRPRKGGINAHGGSAGSRRSPMVPEVTALDGFLSDLQQRLKSVEGGAVRRGHSTVVPTPASSVGGDGDYGRGITRLPKQAATVTGVRDQHDKAGAVSSTSLVDIYGIPQAFVANAEEARRQWEGHHANLEKRDEEFLDRYKRSARMSGVQVSIAKAWRGFVFRRKFLAWRGRRQWSTKHHLHAWCLLTRAEHLYSGNLKRSIFAHWSEIVEEDRNTRVMGERSFQATVSSIRLSRQAVVQFFQDLAPSPDDLSPAVLRNKASVKRRILKILFQSWRDMANVKQKAAAQAAFKMCKAVRLHTASAMLWAPEIVSLLFQIWSRMARYKKAVREEREPPTFLPENGYTSLPEWDAWVTNKGRHLELKRKVIHIGGQIFMRNKFRRWVWFAKWSLSQEDRVLEASQHYDEHRMAKVFAAWAGVCRDRGSMLRRITRCWQGWRSFAKRRKKIKSIKKKTLEHLRLLRTGSVMNDITAYARDGKVLAAFTVSKLLLTNKSFGGLALSYIATGRVTQLFALLAWQAWKKYTTKRRRWKWLLYEHTKTEAFHSKNAVFRAWSYATGRRYRPDAASLTLSASLPFSTWDRFIRNYVDQGVVPAEQLHKDMVDHSVMQQHTAWWLLGQAGAGDAVFNTSRPGAGEGGPLKPSGRMALPQSGGSGGGGLGKLTFPGTPGVKGPTDTDWRALTPALFAAVDECDTAAVIDLLHRGAQVNSIYVPTKVASTGRGATSRKKAATNERDDRSSTTGDAMLEACRALDLPAPVLVANSDGTFEMRGTTPLHAAASHLSADFTSIVVALLHAGACVDALDTEGRTPLQICTSPQTAALLNDHAARLQQCRFSSQELRWGQQVLTISRSSVGAAGLWRYVVRAAVVARLDKLRATLRVEDARAEDAATEAALRKQRQQQLGLSGLASAGYGGVHSHSFGANVGLDEREKELLRMKMERLDAAKTIVDREHALHSGTAGPPSTSGGGGGGGAGGSAQDMKHLFHDLDKMVTLRTGDKETPGALPGSGNSRGGRKRRSTLSTNSHAKSNKRTGKERTAADQRKAFSERRADAASWFRAFREDLARADMLRPIPIAETPASSTSAGSTAGAQARGAHVARKVLAIVRDAGGENRSSGAGGGRGGGNSGRRLNSGVLGGGVGGASMLGRGWNTSGTDAFTIEEVNGCYMALGSVLDERKRVMDQRAARDDALIERGNWVGLQRAMEASKYGQQDGSSTPSSKRRKNTKKKRATSSRSLSPTTASPSAASGSTAMEPSPGTPSMGSHQYGCIEGSLEEGAPDGHRRDFSKASEELVIDVLPTSSSKRCHSASVMLRDTVDTEVLRRAHSTITAWKKGSVEPKGGGRAGYTGTFGQGTMSRVPHEWWGQGGGRVLALMLEERRKLRKKGATLTAQAKELEDQLTSKSENLEQLYSREHEVGTTVRDVAMETKKSETRFREDMERWQDKIQQAQRKIRALTKRRLSIADQTAQLENTLANWDSREIPTASERAKKKKSKEKEEEVTPETLRRDIDTKSSLIMSLSRKESQSLETIENAKVQLNESRVYLLRIQSILTKYASYNMGKMDILEKEFQESSRQQGITKSQQRVLETQIQALFKRLAELDKAISILRPDNTTAPTEKVHGNSATEDNSSLQGKRDVDNEEVSPSTSRRGSNKSSSTTEDAEFSSSKRKRSSGNGSGGHQHESKERDMMDDRDDNSGKRRTKHPSSSAMGVVGPSSILSRISKDKREGAMTLLLTLIDENTAIVDTDMLSLDSIESASTASGTKRRNNRQAKKPKTAGSTKTTTTSAPSAGGTGTATTPSKTKPKPIVIPPSSKEEEAAATLTTPVARPAEATSGGPVSQQPLSASGPSVSSATSPIATTNTASAPKSSRKVQRRGPPSPLQKGSKRKKNHRGSPRRGKAIAGKGNQIGAGPTPEGKVIVVVDEEAKQLDQEQPADADGSALDSLSDSLLALTAENRRLAEVRAAKEAKELAEELEWRRLWEEEDAEELEAWRARRGVEEVLQINPKRSKEETVRLLTAQYDQALKQTFEPERRAAIANRIALVEAEQREKEQKTEEAKAEETRTPEDPRSKDTESNPAEESVFGEKAAEISHLLDDPGLGLTGEEIETLFNIVDEGDGEVAERTVSSGAGDDDGGGIGSDDGATGNQHTRPRVRHADRGLLLFLRKMGLRRTSKEPLENPTDVLNSSSRPRPALKPELDDYMMLNFVGGGNRAGEGDEKNSSVTGGTNKPGSRRIPEESGGGGDGDRSIGDASENSITAGESAVWRGRGNTYNEEAPSRAALNKLEIVQPDGKEDPAKERGHKNVDVADRTAGGDEEAHLYPRTLGSSVSVLDEKDAVLRTGGLRFAGEDPIRGRLRAVDPFLWMGRLNAGTSAISGLLDKANDALKNLDGGSDADSDASDARSTGHRRVGRMQDIQNSCTEVVGPSSRGSGESTKEKVEDSGGEGEMTATQQRSMLSSMMESESAEHEDAGGIDISGASSERFSSSSNVAVDQLSSTMSAYSQSVEAKRVIAGGVVIEEEEEEEEEEEASERDEHAQDDRSKKISPAKPRKGPGVGSGPCPMRASPVNARSAAFGSSAKLRNSDTDVGKAKMTALMDSSSSSSSSMGKGHHISRNSTEATSPTGREDWGEDESQGIQFDDIVSGIARDVASRAPPAPRHSGDGVDVSQTHLMRPSWSAQERASPTRRQRNGTGQGRRHQRRPRSTPAGLRARAEAASAVLDRRPPWSLPLDSLFAPRVKGAVQPNIVTASPRRRFSEADGQIIGDKDGQQRQGMPPRGRTLDVRGASALRRPRPGSSAALGLAAGIPPAGLNRSASSCEDRGRGRQIGSAPQGSVTQEGNLSAEGLPQDIRRCHSASEALLESGLLHEAPRVDDPPAAADGIWSWGWHEDGGQGQPTTASFKDTFTPLMTPELCKRAGRLGLRGTSPVRKKGRSGDALAFENPLSSKAPSLLRHSRNHFNSVDSNLPHGGDRSTRPWTTGEFADSDSCDGATTASFGGVLQCEGGLQSRARSADGVSLLPDLADLRSAVDHPDDAVDLPHAKADGLVGSADSVRKKSRDFFATIGAEGSGDEELEIGDGTDGADDGDDDDCDNSLFPRALPHQMPRRVSFADEQGNSDDGSGDSTEEPSGQNQHRAGRGSQQRRMSGMVGSSSMFLEGDGSITGHPVDRDGRRKSDIERCRKAMEIARVAHNLLFQDTRPDGLRPITGTPMTDGKNAQGSGGLYVGLAGLRGFDLSFAGAVPTSLSDARQYLGSVAARLAASRRLSSHAVAINVEERSVAGGASSSKSDASWIAQGFLLDREPGSLVPRLPPSAGRAPAAEMGQIPPTKNNGTNSEVNVEGGVALPTSEPVANKPRSPKPIESSNESPLSPGSRSNAEQAQHSATTEEDNNTANDSSSSASLLAKEGSPQTHAAPGGSEQMGSGGEVCGRSCGRERTRSGVEGKSGAPVPDVPSGTTVVSRAATAMASLFTPKAAVLWSARDLGVDELVFSVAGDQEVLRSPVSRDYTSRALLAAYKQANPVFEVEASGWSKHEGAIAGVDYPLQPPDGWGGASSDFGAEEKGASGISESERHRVWKSFERRPISRAEARALREVRLSRGLRNGARGPGAGSVGVGESAMRMIMPDLSSDGTVSTSRGTTEDNASVIGSVSDSTAGMSVATISSSLHRPFSETIHPKRRGKTPTVSAGSNTSSNASATSAEGDGQQRKQQQPLQQQGRDRSPNEEKRFCAGENKLPSSETTPGRNLATYHGPGEDGARSMPPSSSLGNTALPWASDLHEDQNDEVPPRNLIAGGVRSGGEGFPPSPNNIPPTMRKSATAPAPGLGVDLGLRNESLFLLDSEADADIVLRAMIRLSSTPSAGSGEVNREKRGAPRHHTLGGSRGKRFTASRGRESGTAAAAADRTTRSAEAENHGVCRGSTPGIKNGQSRTTNAVVRPSSDSEEKVLDIEGLTLRSKARVRQDRYGPSRVSDRSDVARNSGAVESRNVERSGRKSAPQMGRRQRRSGHDQAGAAVGGRKGFVLSESQSAPSGIRQRTRRRPSSSNIGGGNGGGDVDGGGGRTSVDSLIQTLSSSSLPRQGSIPSLTVSSTSGASQQPRLPTSNGTVGGYGFDLRSESNGGTSDEPRMGGASRSEFATAVGSRGRSRGQQQQHRTHAKTRTAKMREGPGKPPLRGSRGSKPLSGSQTKVRSRSRVSAEKAPGDHSAARRGTTKRTSLVGIEPPTTVDGFDGSDGDGDNKTIRELSGIIQGVTSDAASFFLPPRRDSTAETGQPSSPTEEVVETAASASTAAIEKVQRSPSTTEKTLMSPSSGGARAFSDKSNTATSGADTTQRSGETATRRTDNGPEIEGGGKTIRDDGRETNGCATAACSSSRPPDGVSPHNHSTAGKSSLHHPRRPIEGSTTERNVAAGTRATADVTAMGTIAEAQTTVTPGTGGGRKEGAPAVDTGTPKALVSRAAPDAKAYSQEIHTGASGGKGGPCSDEKRSTKGKGVSSSNGSCNNGERTIGSGGCSPNSQGSSASSGDDVPSSPSTKTRQQKINDKKSGSSARKGAQTKEPRTNDDVSRTEVSLPLLSKPETTAASGDAQQDARQHSSIVEEPIAEENQGTKEVLGPEKVVEPQKLPRISGAVGGRSKATGAAAGKTAQHAIKVHSRPARVESKDLQTTTEALTTHHLTLDELLQQDGYDDLLDDSEDEEDAGDRRVRARKEPLLIPHRARLNGMAYWQKREAKERGQRRRPRSANDNELGAVVVKGNSGGDGEGVQAGSNGQWEDEKEEVKRLLLAARERREAAVARVRARRQQARILSGQESLDRIDDSTTATTTTPVPDENGCSVASAAMPGAAVPASANGKPLAKLMPAGVVGGPAAAAKSDDGKGTWGRAALTPPSATVGGEVGGNRSERANGGEPPWKGFTLNDDGEAMLRRGRAPSPERQSPVEGAEDWEYQLVVPGTKDNLVNFSVDTAAVRTNYGKLRRKLEIRQRLGFDEDDDEDASDNELKESDEDDGKNSALQSRNSRAATAGDDEGSNFPDKRQSVLGVLSAEGRGSRNSSTDMPEISIRRRTRIAGVGGDESNAAGSPSPSNDTGTIIQASRIITELEQGQGGFEFPLDVLRRNSEGFGDDDVDNDKE